MNTETKSAEREWRCAAIVCDAPIGQPHAPTCPYADTGADLTVEDCERITLATQRRKGA